LFVDPATDLGPISRYIYGSNYGPWTAFPFNMMDAAFNSHVTVLRWPGGAWGDSNDIQTVQLDTFMGILKQMDAIPTISVRLLNGTPEAAAALVRYANVEKGYKIHYWSIGNEPNLFEAFIKQSYDTGRFNQEWRAIALAMKAVDPSIALLGPELSQFTSDPSYNPKDHAGRDWMTEFLKVNGDLTDIVTIHRYPFPNNGSGIPASIDELRANSAEWDKTIPYLRNLIHEFAGRDIPIGVTEVSSYWSSQTGGKTTPDSFYNAIWYADVLGRLIKQQTFMVNVWVFANRDGGHGLIFGSELRPTYYVFQMYNHFGSQQVYAASGIPNVTIYAAKREDGALTLMVINLSDTEQKVPLQVQGVTLTKAGAWLFDATHNAEDAGSTDLSGGALKLPAQSITLFELPGK
jgi:alpha-L-arabinofuranosidase